MDSRDVKLNMQVVYNDPDDFLDKYEYNGSRHTVVSRSWNSASQEFRYTLHNEWGEKMISISPRYFEPVEDDDPERELERLDEDALEEAYVKAYRKDWS